MAGADSYPLNYTLVDMLTSARQKASADAARKVKSLQTSRHAHAAPRTAASSAPEDDAVPERLPIVQQRHGWRHSCRRHARRRAAARRAAPFPHPASSLDESEPPALMLRPRSFLITPQSNVATMSALPERFSGQTDLQRGPLLPQREQHSAAAAPVEALSAENGRLAEDLEAQHVLQAARQGTALSEGQWQSVHAQYNIDPVKIDVGGLRGTPVGRTAGGRSAFRGALLRLAGECMRFGSASVLARGCPHSPVLCCAAALTRPSAATRPGSCTGWLDAAARSGCKKSPPQSLCPLDMLMSGTAACRFANVCSLPAQA